MCVTEREIDDGACLLRQEAQHMQQAFQGYVVLEERGSEGAGFDDAHACRRHLADRALT